MNNNKNKRIILISIVAIILVVAICLVILLIGNKQKSDNNIENQTEVNEEVNENVNNSNDEDLTDDIDYNALKNLINEASIMYVFDNYSFMENTITEEISLSMLVDNNYIEDETILKLYNDGVCDAYSIVTANAVEIDGNTYLKCENYMTEGYDYSHLKSDSIDDGDSDIPIDSSNNQDHNENDNTINDSNNQESNFNNNNQQNDNLTNNDDNNQNSSTIEKISGSEISTVTIVNSLPVEVKVYHSKLNYIYDKAEILDVAIEKYDCPLGDSEERFGIRVTIKAKKTYDYSEDDDNKSTYRVNILDANNNLLHYVIINSAERISTGIEFTRKFSYIFNEAGNYKIEFVDHDIY